MKTFFGFCLKLLEKVIEFVFFIVFIILFWLRPVIRGFLGVVAIAGFLGILMFVFGLKGQSLPNVFWLLVGVWIGSLLLLWGYDSLLLKLSPRELILFQ